MNKGVKGGIVSKKNIVRRSIISGVSKLINETLYKKATEALKDEVKNGDVSWKLQAIKSSKEHDISKVASIFGISRVTLNAWIKKFAADGVDGLKIQSGRGRKSTLSESEIEQVKVMIEDNPNITIKEIGIKMLKGFNKKLSVGTIYNVITKLKFSYITPRPSHYKSKKASQEEFKKKSRT